MFDSNTTQTVTAAEDSSQRVHVRQLPSVAGYRIVRRLGGGGMGEVFEAIDEKLGVTFALKMIRPECSLDAMGPRFRQEMRAMMLVDHPRIARIYAHGEAEGRPYFTMRYISGGTLGDRRAEFANNPRKAIDLMIKVVEAIDYLHQGGHIHRDLKPSNILLDDRGEPYVSDFGLVKHWTDNHDSDFVAALNSSTVVGQKGSETATRTGVQLGTLAYMSPEQVRGEIRRIGPGSDIWALGIILQELITGHRPVIGKDGVPALPTNVDPQLAAIIGKCLTPDPLNRYASAAALAADLKAWPIAPVRKHRRGLVVATALLVLLATVTIYAATRRGGKRDDAADWRSWARSELRAGREVTLIDDQGNPVPSMRVISGERVAKLDRDSDGWWTVRSTDACLVEFLDNPGLDDFTLMAEVRANWESSVATAGVYTAHQRVATNRGEWHLRLEFLYEENQRNIEIDTGPTAPPPPGAQVVPPAREMIVGGESSQYFLRVHGSSFATSGSIPVDLYSCELGPDSKQMGGPVRKLAIHSRGNKCAASWNGKEVFAGPVLAAKKLERVQDFFTALNSQPIEWNASGGLGVSTSGGSASFRNVRIVPHP